VVLGVSRQGATLQAFVHHDATMASRGKAASKVKEYQLEIPLRWGDMDATPQAFVDQAPRAMASKHEVATT
jgi:hypothetical protein